MCSPTLALTAVAGLASAYQQRQQGKYQKGVADYNARVAENEAIETRNAGVERENIHRRKVAELMSKQRAQAGASGIDINTGSPLQLQQDTELLGEVDALRIRSNFDRRGNALDTQATLTRAQGKQAQAAGNMNAMGTLLSTGATVATGVSDKWMTPDSAAVASNNTTSFNLDLDSAFDTSSLQLN